MFLKMTVLQMCLYFDQYLLWMAIMFAKEVEKYLK